MDAASSAINKLLSNAGQKTSTTEEAETHATAAPVVAPAVATDVDEATVGQKDTTVEQEVAPAVEHEHVKKVHETQEQTVVDRERHQDHYHTTIQPLKDQEIEATKHDQVTADTIEREVNKDGDAAQVKAKADADRAAHKSTHDEELHEKSSKDDTIVGEHVHHHVHETIQPVIERGKPSLMLSLSYRSLFIDAHSRGHQAFSDTQDHSCSRGRPGRVQVRGCYHKGAHFYRRIRSASGR